MATVRQNGRRASGMARSRRGHRGDPVVQMVQTPEARCAVLVVPAETSHAAARQSCHRHRGRDGHWSGDRGGLRARRRCRRRRLRRRSGRGSADAGSHRRLRRSRARGRGRCVAARTGGPPDRCSHLELWRPVRRREQRRHRKGRRVHRLPDRGAEEDPRRQPRGTFSGLAGRRKANDRAGRRRQDHQHLLGPRGPADAAQRAPTARARAACACWRGPSPSSSPRTASP